MKKIKILGAGISGLTAAINLAKAGYKVDVYEKNKDTGMRFHGDMQGLENRKGIDVLEELKQMNIKINFECYPVNNIILTNGVKTSEINTERARYYLVKRGSFDGTVDYDLKKQALEAGIEIHYNKTVPENEVDIVAIGPNFKQITGVAKGIVFNTDLEDMLVLAYGDDLAFKGYSYFIVRNGYACMCSTVIGELDRVNECFENTKEFFEKKYDLNVTSPKIVGGVGSIALNNTYMNGNRMYVGEAAGLQDIVAGFGMRFAIKSGYLAAQSIINDEDYKAVAEKTFENILKAGIVNRYLYEKLFLKNSYSLFIDLLPLCSRHNFSAEKFNILQRMIYPFALSYIKKKYSEI